MKKLLVLFIIMLSATWLIAQNVGIGTTNPLFRLDVGGRMRVKTGTLGNVSSSSGIWFEDYRDGANRFFIGMRDSIHAGFYGSANGGVGWDLVWNAQNGNLGIGIINPANKISLNGALALYSGASDVYGGRIYSDVNDLFIKAKSSFILGGSRGNILFQVPDSRTIEYVGNVGIGVDTPLSKLHIGGTVMIGSGGPAAGYILSVNGKVISEEVRVELDASWPDYVFDKTYVLTPLQQLEQYIRKEKHLPNIPSAKVVEKEGFELGDMNRRLLEKIEELTLYIIEQEKKLNELKKQVEQLRKE